MSEKGEKGDIIIFQEIFTSHSPLEEVDGVRLDFLIFYEDMGSE
jgi:hypothetical protein